MSDSPTLTEADLAQFTGTEKWHRHVFVPSVLFTDGAKYLADQAGAFWLLDEIALAQRHKPKVTAEPFQSWKLKVKADHSARLTCEDGNGQVVYRKHIPYTDFPLEEVTLYYTDNVILLPSEY